MKVFTNEEVMGLASHLAIEVNDAFKKPVLVYPVPRGGVPAAYALSAASPSTIYVTDDIGRADLVVDDLIDSGSTMERYQAAHPGLAFYALLDKRRMADPSEWIVWPWERAEGEKDQSFEDNVVRLLQYVGEDPHREGLTETPARVAKAWREWCDGYGKNPADVLKVFEDGAAGVDEMVVVKDMPFYSHCEHHLAAIFGTATVAYVPKGKIVGLSKLARLVNLFAHRLQVQERLTNQIADALVEHLQPVGAGVVIKARHLCMESRGVCEQGHVTITSALRGALKEKPEARAEFLDLAR